MIRIKSLVISSRGTKWAILLISTTFATVATCNKRYSLEQLRLQKKDIWCSSGGYNLFLLNSLEIRCSFYGLGAIHACSRNTVHEGLDWSGRVLFLRLSLPTPATH